MPRQYLVLVVVAVVLAGCSVSTDYRKAEFIKPMTIPEGIAYEDRKPFYAVPDVAMRQHYESEAFTIPEPPQIEPVISQSMMDDELRSRPDEHIEVERGRDGNGYPIIMMHTRFAWAWEKVGEALKQTGLVVADRNREAGVFYIALPEELDAPVDNAWLTLNQTTNGIQLVFVQPDGQGLLAQEPAKALMDRLYRAL